ncbi:MAG: hypothetical protein A2Z20_00405 [Bdellovibrionales bacterium RBG_16_40_8]|nr:MAG: hypothetical protein A2Z20_00405 [Bdellovibrionales bacterium RBG_16_40_8]
MVLRFNQSVRQIVSFGVIFSLLVPYSVLAQELEKPKDSTKEIASIIAQETAEWSDKNESLVEKLFESAERLEREAARIASLRGENYLKDLIDKNQFILEDSVFGINMSYRIIDNHRVPRFLINNETYIIIDEKIITRESKHLKQYIARIHIESGQNQSKTGRNLTVVYINDDVTSVEHLSKPKPTQWSWWKEYFISKYKRPTLSDVSMAVVTGMLMQGALTIGSTWVKHKMQGTEFSMIPTYWSMGFALGIGSFLSTYRNWAVNSGTRLTRVLKSQLVSSLYAVGLVMAVTDGSIGDRLSTISIFTAEGQAKDISLLANGVMNNYAKDYWAQISRLRETTRENAGNIAIKIPLINKQIDWRRASFEYSVLYLIPWTINVVSLIALASTDWFQVPGTNITVPILQFAGIPVAMYWSKWYARRLAERAKSDFDAAVYADEIEKLAQKYESVWDKYFGLKTFRKIGRKCSDWLK